MASWLTWLTRWIAGPPPTPARARKPAAARPKSPERAANEKFILDKRREILARLETHRAERDTKQKVVQAIDQDTLRAAQVVRAMLRDLETKENS